MHIGAGSGRLDEGGEAVALWDDSGDFVDYLAWRPGAGATVHPSIWTTSVPEATRLASDITAASIALTPNGIDTDQAACFEGTETGSSSCAGAATGNRTYTGFPASPGWDNTSWADIGVGLVVVGAASPVDFEFTTTNAGAATAHDVTTVIRVFDPTFALEIFAGGVVIPPECAADLFTFTLMCDSGDIAPGGSVTHTVGNVSPTVGVYDIQVSATGWNVGPDRSDDANTWTINVT
jgi:hypothetical protein